MAKKKLPSKAKGVEDGMVDMGADLSADDLVYLTAAQTAGAADWLFRSLDAGGGGDADGSLSFVADEDDREQSLDRLAQLNDSALRFGAQLDERGEETVRRLKPSKLMVEMTEYFGSDEEAVFLSASARRIIEAALVKNNENAYAWIFGIKPIIDESTPPRAELLEFFECREFVFQTRVQYQMWRDGVAAEFEFPVRGIDRMILMKVSTILREQEEFGALEDALSLLEIIWSNPGIHQDDLWVKYCTDRAIRTTETNEGPDLDLFRSILQWLDIAYMISKSARNDGWYFTGKNPSREIEDLRRDFKNYNLASMNRGWAAWW